MNAKVLQKGDSSVQETKVESCCEQTRYGRALVLFEHMNVVSYTTRSQSKRLHMGYFTSKQE